MSKKDISIIKCLLDKQYSTAYRISMLLNMQTSSVYSHIKNLEKKGIVLSFTEYDGNRKINIYSLQPFYFNSDFWSDTIDKLKPIMRNIVEQSITDCDVGENILTIVYLMSEKEKNKKPLNALFKRFHYPNHA